MSANIFELLNDEAVNRKQKKPAKEEAKSQPQKAGATKKADTAAPKKAAAPAKPKEANKPAQKGAAGGNKGKAGGGGQRKGGAGAGGGRVTGSGGAIDAVEKKNRASNRREVSKDRNRDNHYKAAKDKLGDGPRGKRTFERRSGTGRPANENKKGGAGRGNWGRNDGTEQVKAEKVEVVAEETEVAKTTEETETREDKEDDKTMTLEEYRKSQAAVRVKAKSKKTRQANEGEDESKWADFTPLSKEDELANAKKAAATKEKEQPATQDNKKTKKKTVKKVPLQDIIDTRSSNNNNSKPRGRGRGAGQGFDKKPARGGKRADKPGQANKELALDDDSSFPALG